jgi:hypothetical protein
VTLANGVFIPPEIGFIADVTFPGLLTSRVTVESCERYAGTTVGTAVVTFREIHASGGQLGYGKEARITAAGSTIFRGTLGSGDLEITSIRDGVSIMLYDDKWGMQSRIIGQKGFGTILTGDHGFTDVGFDIVFNRDGRPNKSPSTLDFQTGSGAVFWKLIDVMKFIFEYYVNSSTAQLNDNRLDDDYELVPSHLALTGMNALQAVDQVAQLAGQSWGLETTAMSSQFVAVKPNASSTRTAILFLPFDGKKAVNATEWHASRVLVRGSVMNARDVHQAKSAPVVIERMYTSTGTDPLLTRQTGFVDAKFRARFVVDVTKYETYSLGKNLTAGSPAKPWLANLVTRRKVDGSGYITAAEIEADPSLQGATLVEIPIWVELEHGGTLGDNAQLAVGGYEIDYEKGLIDFEGTLEVLAANGLKGTLAITDFSKLRVWITVATVMEYPQFTETDTNSKYLPEPFYNLIDKQDLRPERRFNSWLPDLASTTNVNARTILAPSAEEKYVDVTDRLEEAVAAALAATAERETPITATFPLMPLLEIGDNLNLGGRSLGPTGREVVIAIRYNMHQRYTTEVDATNITVGIDPDRFIRK